MTAMMAPLHLSTTTLLRVFCGPSNTFAKSINLRNLAPRINDVILASIRRKPSPGCCLPINIPEFNRDKAFRIAPDPDAHPPRIPRRSSQYQEVIEDRTEENRQNSRAIIEKVNEHIASGNAGRLFAVIYVHGKQYRVVNNDILVLERWWPPTVGDKIILEKVLLVGGSSFSLVGKPVLPNNLVRVHATILNKDLTHTKISFHHIPKERVHRIKFIREETTYLRINEIELHPKLNVSEPAIYTRL